MNPAQTLTSAPDRKLDLDGADGRQWPLLMTLAGIQFTHVLDFVIIMPLGPQLIRVLDLTPAGFGALVSAYNLAAAGASLIGAFFLDRFDRKTVLSVIYAGFTLGTMVCALVPDATHLMVARIATGAFGGLIQAIIFAIIGDRFVEERRGAATGTVMSAFSLASIVGVPVGLFLADHFNWRAPFFILALICSGFLVAIGRALPPLRQHLHEAQTPSVRAVVGLAFERNSLVAFALTVSLMFAGFLVIPFLSAYLVLNVGLSESQLAFVFFTGGLATLISSRLIGRIADRTGKAHLFTWLATLSVFPILFLTNLAHVTAHVFGYASVISAILVSTVFTVLISARGIPALAMITSSIERARRGSFLSLTSAVQQASSGAASLAAGALLDRDPDGKITNFGLVGALAAAATLISVCAARNLRVSS